ncbi:MAG TPA: hypothetical protein DD670_20545, partial [Planctomycetaceae bacterium]|nr:hypothetical protein [Planctomycetaceae bacterium]
MKLLHCFGSRAQKRRQPSRSCLDWGHPNGLKRFRNQTRKARIEMLESRMLLSFD